MTEEGGCIMIKGAMGMNLWGQ